jgi:hypothetical protein
MNLLDAVKEIKDKIEVVLTSKDMVVKGPQEVFNLLSYARAHVKYAKAVLEKAKPSDPVSEAAKRGFENG